MKKFNIMGVYHFLEVWGHKKNNGDLPKKGGLGNLQGTWQKRERVFLKGD